MLEKSDESQLYFDESFLAFFHIIELLATEYEDELKTNIKSKIETFVDNLLHDTFQYGSIKLSNEKNLKGKLIEQLFIPELSVSVKISHLFTKLGLFSKKTRQLIEDYVKLRNDLAHGRAVFNRRMRWPLPPFFRQSNNVAFEIYTIALLSAAVIDAYIGSNIYKYSWEDYFTTYPPALEDVRKFIRDKRYVNLSTKRFRSAGVLGVAPWVLTHYLLAGKIKIESYEPALEDFILNIPVNKVNLIQFLPVAIILSDSNNEALTNKCRLMVKKPLNWWMST